MVIEYDVMVVVKFCVVSSLFVWFFVFWVMILFIGSGAVTVLRNCGFGAMYLCLIFMGSVFMYDWILVIIFDFLFSLWYEVLFVVNEFRIFLARLIVYEFWRRNFLRNVSSAVLVFSKVMMLWYFWCVVILIGCLFMLFVWLILVLYLCIRVWSVLSVLELVVECVGVLSFLFMMFGFILWVYN